MIKYLIQKIFSPKIKVNDNLIPEFLNPYCILFGSYAYGTPTKKSDVDLLMQDKDYTTLQADLKKAGIAFVSKRTNFYIINLRTVSFHCNSKLYNVSIVSSNTFENAKFATNILVSYSEKIAPISFKQLRIYWFEELVDFNKYSNMERLPTKLSNFIATHHPECII